MKKIIYIVMAFFIPIFLFTVSNATENDDINKFISDMSSRSITILNNKKTAERQKQKEYKQFAETIVDCDWVARFILGTHWREINDAQKKDFISSYKEYLLENYIPKLKDYNRDIVVMKIMKQKDKVFMVSTKTKDKNNKEINVDFRIIKKPEGLFITDIIPEGISFIGNQRTDVNYSISQNGFDKFMEDLKKKI